MRHPKCALKCKVDVYGEAENSLPTTEGGVEVFKPEVDLLLLDLLLLHGTVVVNPLMNIPRLESTK